MYIVILSILKALMIIIAAKLFGRVTRRWWAFHEYAWWQRATIEISLGMGVLSAAVFLAGILGLMHSTIISVGLFVAVVLEAGLAFRDWWEAEYVERTVHRPHVATVIAVLVLVTIAGIALISALAPPVWDDWDGLAYHLAVPKLYLDHGGIYFIDYITHSNFPFLVEMLFALGLTTGAVAAKLVHFAIYILTMGAISTVISKHFNNRGHFIALVLFASSPIIMWEAGCAYVDIASALFIVLSAHFALSYIKSGDMRHASVAGLSSGLSAGVKMTSLSVVVLIAVWMFVARYMEVRKADWQAAVRVFVFAFFACFFWYAKSFFYTGNPLFPFAYSMFGGSHWSAELAANYARDLRVYGLGYSLADFFKLPYNLVSVPAAFNPGVGHSTGPVFLFAAIMLPFMFEKVSREKIGILLFGLLQLILWFILSQQSRFIIPLVAIFAIYTAVVCANLHRFRLVTLIITCLVAVTAAFGIMENRVHWQFAWPVATGLETRDTYKSRMLDIYGAQMQINNMPEVGVVAIYGDTRGYYLDKDYVWADYGHNLRFSRDFDAASLYRDYLKGQGVTHVLVNYRFFVSRENASGVSENVWECIERGYFVPVYGPKQPGEGVAVYEIE